MYVCISIIVVVDVGQRCAVRESVTVYKESVREKEVVASIVTARWRRREQERSLSLCPLFVFLS